MIRLEHFVMNTDQIIAMLAEPAILIAAQAVEMSAAYREWLGSLVTHAALA